VSNIAHNLALGLERFQVKRERDSFKFILKTDAILKTVVFTAQQLGGCILGTHMKTDRLTACQARAARAMLKWPIEHLAKKAKISVSSIRRIEASFGVPDNVTLDMLAYLQEYFESRGFIFSWADEAGPGVHWPRYPGRFNPGDRRVAPP
jgi:hypothetical protein